MKKSLLCICVATVSLSAYAAFANQKIVNETENYYKADLSNEPVIKTKILGTNTYLTGNYAYVAECAGFIRDVRSGQWVVQNKCSQHLRFQIIFYGGRQYTTRNCLGYAGAEYTHQSIQVTYPLSVRQFPCSG